MSLSFQPGPGQVFLVNIQPAVPLQLDVNQTAVALYKVGGVNKDDARLLQKQDVDSDALPYLNDDVLTKMGVPTFGRRVKILKAAQAILAGTAGAAQPQQQQPPVNASYSAPYTQPQMSPVTQSTNFSSASASASEPRRPSPEPQSSSYVNVSPSAPQGSDDDGEDDEYAEHEFVPPKLQKAEEAAALKAQQAEKAAAERAARIAANGGVDDMEGLEDASGAGESFMAVKPWLGAIKEPSKAPKSNPEAPSRKLSIDWVHGFRAFDSRSNLVYNAVGDVVYPVAGLCVVYSPKTRKQRYFRGHNDDVRCVAQHPRDKNLMASGQNATIVNGKGAPPFLCVWDSSNPESGKTVTIQLTQADRAARAVGFIGEGGRYLASVSNDDNHMIKVWDWKSGTKVCEGKCDANPIYALRANPRNPDEFVTIGAKHLMFWTFSGSSIKGKRASAGSKPMSFFSVCYADNGSLIAGAEDGNGYIFKGGAVSKVIPMHQGPKAKVLSIEPTPEGGFVSGGSDKSVRVWDAKMAPVCEHTFSEHVTSVFPSASGQDLLVGTRAGDVFEVRDYQSCAALQGDRDLDAITRGHADGELWALAVVRGGQNFVTAGEDNTICLWSVDKRKMLKRAQISDKAVKAPLIKKASTTSTHPVNQCARACAISPDKKTIVIGCNNGEVAVFDTKTLQRKHLIDLNKFGKRNVTNQTGNWIQAIQFSPSGNTVAVGTHGSVVCLLDAREEFKCKGVCNKSSSAISALDWSENGSYIQTVDLGYELLFYSVDEEDLSKGGKQVSATLVKDEAWATFTCKLGWPVQGIFDPSQGGQDINTVDVNAGRTLVATGDDDGNVKLFRYPALKGAKANAYGGHSSHVVTTRFTPDDKYLISTGGHDKSIIQWSLS